MNKNNIKKLVITKETVRVLTDEQLKEVAGGAGPVTTAYPCNHTRIGCQTKGCTTAIRC